MLRKLSLILLIATPFIITSCHKTNSPAPGNPAQLIGNYKLLYLSANIQAVTQESAGGQTQKTIAYNNYKTTDNTGTVTFSKDSIAWKGISYSADYDILSYDYINGALANTMTIPFSESLSPVNATTKYDVFGQDSIYVHGGYPTSGLGGSAGSTVIAPPSGGRFSFKGDTLFLTSKLYQASPPQTVSGITLTSSASGIAIMALLKQ